MQVSPGNLRLIPVIDIAALFQPDEAGRQRVDQALFAAARESGFLSVRGQPQTEAIGADAMARLLAIFRMSDAAKRLLYRRKFAPQNSNIYRGWFPVQPGHLTCKEGIDIGGDVAHGSRITVPGDPLREPTPLPQGAEFAEWRATVASYYRAMEQTAAVLMASLSRSLRLPQDYFEPYFRGGLSTLRLIRYPARSAAELASVTDPTLWVAGTPGPRHLIGAPHTDSGFLTLLAQDRVGGLQARSRDAQWIDVPPLEGTLVVNFGQVLEEWSAGRVRATEHRVLGDGIERYSIPFFYEAHAEATIAPLPIDPPDRFVPFEYGDFLWRRMTKFVEFRGLEGARHTRAS